VTSFEVRAIGKVASPLTDLGSAPLQADEGAPEAWLVFDPEVLEGLRSLRPGDQVIVITWLDRARRDVLSVHPRGEPSRAQEGVFRTRHAPQEAAVQASRGNWRTWQSAARATSARVRPEAMGTYLPDTRHTP
jgi:hypothetical protein